MLFLINQVDDQTNRENINDFAYVTDTRCISQSSSLLSIDLPISYNIHEMIFAPYCSTTFVKGIWRGHRRTDYI